MPTCKFCGNSLAFDDVFKEWFHVEKPQRGETAIFCIGTKTIAEPLEGE